MSEEFKKKLPLTVDVKSNTDTSTPKYDDRKTIPLRHTLTYANLSPHHIKAGSVFNPITVSYGVHSIKGKRPSMEDAHKAIVEEPDETIDDSYEGQNDNTSFFGVYDGHGGEKAAKFVSHHLHKLILSHSKFSTDPVLAIKEGFLEVERLYLQKSVKDQLGDGTTATIAILVNSMMYVAHVGDSDAVLARGHKSILLTQPHNLKANVEERDRVKQSGGVIIHGRLGHPFLNPEFASLGVSRAIGDSIFKDPAFTDGKPSGLIAEPEIEKISLIPEDQFVILACDGVWDVFKHHDAVAFVHKALLENGNDPQKAAIELVHSALSRGSTDNITALIILLHHALSTSHQSSIETHKPTTTTSGAAPVSAVPQVNQTSNVPISK